MTQRELATRVGVSVPTLAKLENGNPSTSVATVLRALTVLSLDGDTDLLAQADPLQGAAGQPTAEAGVFCKEQAMNLLFLHDTSKCKETFIEVPTWLFLDHYIYKQPYYSAILHISHSLVTDVCLCTLYLAVAMFS